MLDPSGLTQVVAIDGPAGAGKSTVARRVAGELGFHFLDSGAMYRAATWHCLDRGVNLSDENAVVQAVAEMPLRLIETPAGLEVRIDGTDVTRAIRTPEVTAAIHCIDAYPGVRAQLVAQQRAFAQRGPTVAEGRDMGTVVFPHAKCKIFLVAAIEERARRRALEWAQAGHAVDLDRLIADIRLRDERNETRTHSPLVQAPDAERLDTTNLTLDEAVAAIIERAKEAW